jgi:hypothetical protein
MTPNYGFTGHFALRKCSFYSTTIHNLVTTMGKPLARGMLDHGSVTTGRQTREPRACRSRHACRALTVVLHPRHHRFVAVLSAP